MSMSKFFLVTTLDNTHANNILTHISTLLNVGFWVAEEVAFMNFDDGQLLDQKAESFRQIPHDTAHIDGMLREDFHWLASHNHFAFDWSSVYYFQNIGDLDKAITNQPITTDFAALSIDGPKLWLFSTKLFDLEELFKAHHIQYKVAEAHYLSYVNQLYELI